MATRQEITNKAVGFKHLGPGAMIDVFKQQPARNTVTKQFGIGSCGARVALQAHTTAAAVVMAAGECGLSGVICQSCMKEINAIIDHSEAELLAEAEEEPGLHGQG